ncbi:MAG: hypothetical protein ABI895_04625 [Deltaproteobacteria bacterium]
MHRPPFTAADLAVLRCAHFNAKAHQPAEPQPLQPEQQRPFWGLLAQKLSALLAQNRSGVAGLALPERNARREV